MGKVIFTMYADLYCRVAMLFYCTEISMWASSVRRTSNEVFGHTVRNRSSGSALSYRVSNFDVSGVQSSFERFSWWLNMSNLKLGKAVKLLLNFILKWLWFYCSGPGVHFPRQDEDQNFCVYKVISRTLKYCKCDSALEIRDDFVYRWDKELDYEINPFY